MEVTIITKRQKSSSSKVKSKDNAEILKCLMKIILRVRPEYSKPGSWSFLHDNAHSHRAVAVEEISADKQVCVLNHSPYSPDLSPCDYFLLAKLKIPMKDECLRMLKSFKALDHRFFGPYHKSCCRNLLILYKSHNGRFLSTKCVAQKSSHILDDSILHGMELRKDLTASHNPNFALTTVRGGIIHQSDKIGAENSICGKRELKWSGRDDKTGGILTWQAVIRLSRLEVKRKDRRQPLKTAQDV
ncbi:hypothetical protein LAZ67_X000121 [Cordylochernes scorpioides]|uniref:Transposase n=1 Tax=Cordylochernes scorpioides TaxID=51811 RepID=A0ABY6LSG5_9ARAC|nr:hypothetical protein LAZ67_X000121 [Cordylochernes scorpioides]